MKIQLFYALTSLSDSPTYLHMQDIDIAIDTDKNQKCIITEVNKLKER